MNLWVTACVCRDHSVKLGTNTPPQLQGNGGGVSCSRLCKAFGENGQDLSNLRSLVNCQMLQKSNIGLHDQPSREWFRV
jgi:hypothetical protein